MATSVVTSNGIKTTTVTDDDTGDIVSVLFEDDDSSKGWTSISDTYEAGELAHRIWLYDNGNAFLQGPTLGDFDFLGILGDSAKRAEALSVIEGALDAGATKITWSEGGATNNAVFNSDADVVVTASDTSGASWRQSVFTFDDVTGDRLSKVTTMDDNSVITRLFTDDVLVSDTSTNIPGEVDTFTVLYRPDGSWESREKTFDAGDKVVLETFDGSSSLVTVDTSNFNSLGQLVSQTVQDVGDLVAGTKSVTTIFDPDSGDVIERTTLGDDGNTTVQTFGPGEVLESVVISDGGPNQSWSTITQTYVGGVFDTSYFAYDSGSGIVQGSAGDNTLTGGLGKNDAMIGNAGVDTFVFEVGGKSDRVLDFDLLSDTLDLTAFGVGSVADISNEAVSVDDSGPHLIIDFGGGDTVQINGIDLTDLTDGNIVDELLV